MAANSKINHYIISGELVKDLKSSDVEVRQKAIKEADCYIAALDEPCRTNVNKTTINTNPPLQPFLVKTCIQGHPLSVVLLLLHSVCLSHSHFLCPHLSFSLLLAQSLKEIQYKTNNFLLCCLSCRAAWIWVKYELQFISRRIEITILSHNSWAIYFFLFILNFVFIATFIKTKQTMWSLLIWNGTVC